GRANGEWQEARAQLVFRTCWTLRNERIPRRGMAQPPSVVHASASDICPWHVVPGQRATALVRIMRAFTLPRLAAQQIAVCCRPQLLFASQCVAACLHAFVRRWSRTAALMMSWAHFTYAPCAFEPAQSQEAATTLRTASMLVTSGHAAVEQAA